MLGRNHCLQELTGAQLRWDPCLSTVVAQNVDLYLSLPHVAVSPAPSTMPGTS